MSRHKAFGKAGSTRTSDFHIVGLSMAAIRVSNLEILSARTTEVLTAVECLKPGQKACTADSDGNIGAGNKGKNNFGTKNVGNNNIGERLAGCKWHAICAQLLQPWVEVIQRSNGSHSRR